MRSLSCTLALPALLALVRAASADFDFSYAIQPGAPDANHTRVQFFARNDGAHNTGLRVLGEDLELVSDRNMLIVTSSTLADVAGVGASDPYHSDRSFINILGDPANPDDSDPSQLRIDISTPNQHLVSAYAGGITDFRLLCAHQLNYGRHCHRRGERRPRRVGGNCRGPRRRNLREAGSVGHRW